VFDLELSLKGLKKIIGGGTGVITIPLERGISTIQHYPAIKSFQKTDFGINWVDNEGIEHADFNPIWHGGDGNTLEVRQIVDVTFERLLILNEFDFSKEIFLDSGLGVMNIGENHGFYIVKNL
jgi:hypothetical protein